MSKVVNISFVSIQIALVLTGCASRDGAEKDVQERLRAIIIQDEKVSGSPKEIVVQLNKLAKKYDVPDHESVVIGFDPAVDATPSSLTIFRGGEPLVSWLNDVCESCGSRYRIDGKQVLIELLPLSEKRTANLESTLTNGLADLCRQFRLKRGKSLWVSRSSPFRSSTPVGGCR